MTLRSVLVLAAVVAVSSLGCSRSSPPPSAPAPGAESEQRIVDEAAQAVTRIRADPRFSAFDTYLKSARGVVIFPHLVKASLILGGQGGTGVLVGRATDGSFSAPAFYGIGAGSFGPQVGYQEATVVLLLMNDGALWAVLRSGLTLGADATVAAGRDNSEASAATSTKDVVAFVDAGGLFAGASVAGAVVEPRSKLSRAYYGADIVPAQVVIDRKFDHAGANGLRAALAAKGGAAPSATAAASPAPADAPKLSPPAGQEEHKCSPESRQADVCTMIFAPVCAVVDTGVRCIAAPCNEASKLAQFSNACSACKEKSTLGYYEGACASSAVK